MSGADEGAPGEAEDELALAPETSEGGDVEGKKPAAPPTDGSRSVENDEPKGPSIFERARDAILAPFVEIGMLVSMFGQAIYWTFRPPFRFRQLILALENVGIGSIFIVALTGFFLGAVLGLQLSEGFRQVGLQNQTGGVVADALAREIGPVFGALMITARAGSAMAAKLGSMRVSNQIDALVAMAVNPVQFLVTPRVLAGAIAAPLLTTLFDMMAMFGAWLVCINLLGLDEGLFIDRARFQVTPEELMQGVIKSMIFGATVCLIACRQGFHASGGAEGVGRATNRAVVHCAIAILALDYVVTALIVGRGL